MFEKLKVLFYLWSVWLVFTCLLTEGLSASRSQKKVFDLNVFSDRKGYGNESYHVKIDMVIGKAHTRMY